MVFAGRKSRTWDHPRVCREKFQHISGIFQLEGSPPHVRGKDFFRFYRLFTNGITPAYAGKRPVKHTIEHLHGDHPRVCGEKYMGVPTKVKKPGSPPRMRGKVKNGMQ